MGLLKTAAKVAVASSVHGWVQRRQQQRWAAQDAAAAASAGTAAPPAQTDIQQQLALISQLTQLRDAGALTDAEFEAKKAEILRL